MDKIKIGIVGYGNIGPRSRAVLLNVMHDMELKLQYLQEEILPPFPFLQKGLLKALFSDMTHLQ